MVIDMMEFQNVTLDAATGIASVGAGLRLGNMATKLFQLGQRGYAVSPNFRVQAVAEL